MLPPPPHLRSSGVSAAILKQTDENGGEFKKGGVGQNEAQARNGDICDLLRTGQGRADVSVFINKHLLLENELTLQAEANVIRIQLPILIRD